MIAAGIGWAVVYNGDDVTKKEFFTCILSFKRDVQPSIVSVFALRSYSGLRSCVFRLLFVVTKPLSCVQPVM